MNPNPKNDAKQASYVGAKLYKMITVKSNVITPSVVGLLPNLLIVQCAVFKHIYGDNQQQELTYRKLSQR